MIVRAMPNGSMVRLKDVARVELGAIPPWKALERQAERVSLTFLHRGRTRWKR